MFLFKKSLYLQSCANLAPNPHLTFCLCLLHETKQSTKQYCKCRKQCRQIPLWGGGVVGPFHQYHHNACVFFQILMDEVHNHRQESQGGHRSNRARVLGFVPCIGSDIWGVAGCWLLGAIREDWDVQFFLNSKNHRGWDVFSHVLISESWFAFSFCYWGVKPAKPSRSSTSKKVLGNKQLLKEVLAFGQSRSSNLSQLGGDGLCLEVNERRSDKVESGFWHPV